MNARNILINLNEEMKAVQTCSWLHLAKYIYQKKDKKKKIRGKETSTISYYKIVGCLIWTKNVDRP